MQAEDFERRAIRVLNSVPPYIWDRESLPVPVERIAADHYCLRVCHKSPEQMAAAPGCPALEPGQSLSGLLLVDAGEIWVNADEYAGWPGRTRFTICHELGHWVMHRQARRRGLYCRSKTMASGEKDATAGDEAEEPDIEEEAHLFAAAMLMPWPLVEREYERDREFQRLCERFGASGAAMGRRLHRVI